MAKLIKRNFLTKNFDSVWNMGLFNPLEFVQLVMATVDGRKTCALPGKGISPCWRIL